MTLTGPMGEDEAALNALLAAADPPVGRAAAMTAARLFLDELGLPMPPLPRDRLEALAALGPGWFATRAGLLGPDETEAWLERLRAGTLPEHLAFGLGGRGFSGRTLAYAYLEGPLALLIRIPWGGAYDDPLVQADLVRRSFDRIARLITAEGLSRLPAGRRLVVVEGDPFGNRLGWLDERGQGLLLPHPDPLAEALALVEGMAGLGR